ncbi:MAG: hypothetical protein P8018_03825 [Acidobacteriota bacterium]
MVLFVPFVCVIILGIIFVFFTEASNFSKAVVGVLVVGSVAVKFGAPRFWLLVLIVQVILSIAILLYLKVAH